MKFNTVYRIIAVLVFTVTPATLMAGETYMSGFLQGLYGAGIDRDNPTSSEYTASESRLQLRMESFSDNAEFFGRLDFVYDDYNDPNVDLELREAFMKFRMFDKLDFKIGRQIITWGTGDLIFINDLFAKDYRSFFTGRDDQYLKAPQNALRMEYYSPIGTFSGIFTPRFTPNRVPTGERLSYFNPFANQIVGGSDFYFEGEIRLRHPKIFSVRTLARTGRARCPRRSSRTVKSPRASAAISATPTSPCISTTASTRIPKPSICSIPSRIIPG